MKQEAVLFLIFISILSMWVVRSMQVQVPPKPRTYETLLERIVDQSDDSTGFLLLMRNQILKSCNIGCNYDWKKEESFGLKDPLTECQVYWWLSKTDNEKVSRQIGEIYFSDRALIKTSVMSPLK